MREGFKQGGGEVWQVASLENGELGRMGGGRMVARLGGGYKSLARVVPNPLRF